ncbi:MAG TPA: class I SAM-dependent methyltransferase [Dokdonella sp.]|uniref:class I SAM-dependent methyltransferase n=1 Tax=Dokdonella sp. TaxID=2291710 RepID=UPI002D7FA7B9|nr:class I SAM-dependent methyltransferase [Dokdonella sp.]HET9034469.1 class I SAM-dependent methyltransferase [Dokdonella sp.]
MNFKDHFSAHAAIYREARPRYPAALFDFLAAQAPSTTRAWDPGCGNGQASVDLARRFDEVIATDPSVEQIAHAIPRSNIHYRAEPAERTSIDAASIDLVCVAQALHWFELDRFHDEVRRVLRPRGMVAFWCYADCRVDAVIDALKNRVYVDLTGPYWPPERTLIEGGYSDLSFPFERIVAPPIELCMQWNLDHFLAYLRSWSATQRYIRANGQDPVSLVENEMRQAWGDPARLRAVRWDFHLQCGRLQ